MKKTIITFLKALLLFATFYLLYLNIKLYYQPTFKNINGTIINRDVYYQLQFLKQTIKNNAGTEMQNIYPEGFIFLNVLYGLAWCDLIKNKPSTSTIFKEGITEIDYALSEISSSQAKIIFSPDLALPYGAFYNSWNNYLLAKKLSLSTVLQDSIALKRFKFQSNIIAKAIQKSSIPYIASYENGTWPSDIIVGVASLAIYNEIIDDKYHPLIKQWLKKVEQGLTPFAQLIPHVVDSNTGESYGLPRGCSQSLMLNFMFEIDSVFGHNQYKRYKKHFFENRFGLLGIREYPKGKNGKGDIDSGPILLDIGGAASIVGIRTSFLYQDYTTYQSLRNSVEAFGIPLTWNKKKRYLLGQLPIADAFITWGNSIHHQPISDLPTSMNYWIFHLLSLSIILMIAYLYFSIFKKYSAAENDDN